MDSLVKRLCTEDGRDRQPTTTLLCRVVPCCADGRHVRGHGPLFLDVFPPYGIDGHLVELLIPPIATVSANSREGEAGPQRGRQQ